MTGTGVEVWAAMSRGLVETKGPPVHRDMKGQNLQWNQFEIYRHPDLAGLGSV